MTRIDAITRTSGINPNPRRAAQYAGSGASRVVRSAISDKSLGPAATVTLSPRAQAILAAKGEAKGSSAPDVTLPVVGASCALVGYKFKRKKS